MAYFSLRDLDDDLDLDFEDGSNIPDVNTDALFGPDANEARAVNAVTGMHIWTHHLGSNARYVGSSAETLVFTAGRDLIGVDATTKTIEWKRSAPSGGIGLADGVVVFADGRGSTSLTAVDAVSGAERWRVPGAVVRSSPILVGSATAVVISNGDGQTQAFDLGSGELRWTTARFRGFVSGVVAGDVAVLQTGTGAAAIELSTGATRWNWTAPGAISMSDASIYGSLLDGPLEAGALAGVQVLEQTEADALPTTATAFLDLATGVEIWRTPAGALTSFAYDAATNTVFELGDPGRLIARDVATGAPRWEAPAPFGRLLAREGHAFVADESVRVFDAATGAEGWSLFIAFDAAATPVGVVSGQLILMSDGPATKPS